MHSGPSLTTCRSHAIPEACKRAFPLSPLARDMAGLTAANATIAAANPKTLKHQHAQPCHLAPDHLDFALPLLSKAVGSFCLVYLPALSCIHPPANPKSSSSTRHSLLSTIIRKHRRLRLRLLDPRLGLHLQPTQPLQSFHSALASQRLLAEPARQRHHS